MFKPINSLIFLLVILIPVFMTSCGASRQAARLDTHKSMLTLLAESDQAPEEKLDVMMSDFTKMMHESLDILNPKRGVAFVKQYGQQNEKAIRSILDEVSLIPEQLNTFQMIEFALGLTSKPYMSDFIDLLPRFQRRYNQISFVLGLTGKLKDGLLNLGLKSLGL